MKSILIIEDNDNFLDNLSECLKLEGYEVLTAADGRAGLETAKTLVPDLIICDSLMPVLTGFEVLAQLKAADETNRIPFIFSTSQSEKADVKTAMELGADDYFIKPYNMEYLVDRIAGLINEVQKL
jgi:DNA-binding response OmpR family regulator